MKRFLGAACVFSALSLSAASARADEVRVVVGFKGPPARTLIQEHDGRVHGQVGSAVVASLPPSRVSALRALAAVAYVEEDVVFEASTPGNGKAKGHNKPTPEPEPEPAPPPPPPPAPPPEPTKPPTAPPMTGPAQVVPWGITKVDSLSTAYTGAGAIVAVIDSGIDASHPDLWANIGKLKDYVSNTADDQYGHGTHVAGTIAAVDNTIGVVGVAPQATLYVARVLDQNGLGYASTIAAAVRWAADEGADIANLSLAGPATTATLNSACAYAETQGVLLIAAAGNSGDGNLFTNETAYPAALSSCVAVGATTSSDALASFSNTNSWLEVCAPGTNVVSTYPGGGYATYQGTSMAAPHAAGVAAILIQYGSTPAIVRSHLQSLTRDLGTPGHDNGFGHGIVDCDPTDSN